jgi:hypothetical protein
MPLLLVAYDIHPANASQSEKKKAATRREQIRDRITERYPEHRRLSESAYAIDTHERPSRVSRRVFLLVEEQDEYHVIPLRAPSESFGSARTAEWLQARLPR